MEEKKKIKYNLLVGILSQVITIALGIIIPRITLQSYGSEVNGLLNSVTQIYAYIALLEAGVGVSTVQALYRTIGNGEKGNTNAVLAATNKYYRKTGLWYLVAILLFSFIYPLIIDTEIPTITVILVIVFNGAGSVINYFYQAKYFLLLQAEGKNYIRTTLDLFTNIFKNIAKIILISIGLDVVFVQMIAMAISLIQMSYVKWYITKNYDWIDLSVKPDWQSISQSKNVLVHQISGLVYNNTDTITLTVFCGLKTVSVYSLYTLLFGMISTALNTVSGSVIFKIGQMFHKDWKKFIKMYDAYEVFYMALVFSLYSIAFFFIEPFIKLYTSGILDINYVDSWLPILFISTYLLSCGRSAPNLAINFAGKFRDTQNRAIAEALINIVVSVGAVQFFGIYGVLFGTIVALLYRTNDMILYANKYVLCRTPWYTYKRWLRNVALFILIFFLSNLLVVEFKSYFSIFLWCIPYSIAVLLCYFLVSCIFEKEAARFIFDSVLKRK